MKLQNIEWKLFFFNKIEEEYEDNVSDVSSMMGFSDEERDEVCSLDRPRTFRNEEIRSRFSSCSMSSSVIRRNEKLTLLDDKFEKVSLCLFL